MLLFINGENAIDSRYTTNLVGHDFMNGSCQPILRACSQVRHLRFWRKFIFMAEALID